MDEGDASSWKEKFIEEATSTSPHDYGTWANFEKNIKEAFQPFDAPGDALEEITVLYTPPPIPRESRWNGRND